MELARMGTTVIAVGRDQGRSEEAVRAIKAQSGSDDVHLAGRGGMTGKYFDKWAEARSSMASHDRETAARLWKASEELTGLAAST